MFDHKFAPKSVAIAKPLAERWSPYGFSDRPIPDTDLQALFEAARWAASSYNEQPWRFILVRKNDGEAAYNDAMSCLLEANQVWAANAPVLVFACTVEDLGQSGKPNKAAEHDLGIAAANLTFEAQMRGISVHQIIGILPDKVRELYQVPEGVQPLTALAIGYADAPVGFPAHLQERDDSPRQRRPLSETLFTSRWGDPAWP